jgi:hypothetical protein
MASIASNHTVRTVAGHVRHVLFPSRRQAIFGMAVDVVALLLHIPFVAHPLLDVIVQVAFALAARR